ncbi:MAG: Hsp20/alpha crystallin family protein [Candidatus Glassbacteria bacterium]
MTLVRWKPMRDWLSLQRDMNRAFNEFFRFPGTEVELFERDWVPAVDIFEKDDEITLKAELPGLTKDDVNISIENGSLTITGEKKRENEFSDENCQRIERSYGKFQRTFSLPSTVDSSKVNAVFKDGVLSISLGKKEEAKPKKIEVKVS